MADPRLAELYGQLPHLACRGLCHASCGPVAGGPAEVRALAARGITLSPIAGVLQQLAAGEPVQDCPALTPYGRCGVYEDRPMICRLYGSVRSLACPHGCVPERWLDEEDSRALLAEATEVR